MARESFKATPTDQDKLVKLPSSADDLPKQVIVDTNDKDNPNNFVVIDDTPPDQKGSKEWNGKSAAEEEAGHKDDNPNVQKRIDRLRAEVGTNQRRAEAAERERDTAATELRRYMEENQRLRDAQNRGTTALAQSMIGERRAMAEDATRRLEAAHAAGDSAAIAKATADLTKANAELAQIEARVPQQQQTPPERQQQTQQQPPQQQQPGQPQFAPAVSRWLDHNKSWWNRDREKTAKALSIHYALESEGITPDKPEYTREVDKRLQTSYPDHEPYEIDTSMSEDSRRETSPPRRSDGGERGSREDSTFTPPNLKEGQVMLTQSEISLANRMRIPLAEYARQKQARQNREGGAR